MLSKGPFDGLRVLALESRRAAEIEKLIRGRGGDPFVAPSMREVSLEDNPHALSFASRLFADEFDMMILLTGTGVRRLRQIVEARYRPPAFVDALRKLAVVCRGPKPAAAMREWGVPIAVTVPEPNTWREVLKAIEGRPEKHIVVQEFGRPSVELLDGLRARGLDVSAVPVYQWALPEDTAPLRKAAHKLAAGEFDVAMFTTSVQIEHLLRIASEEGIEDRVRGALARIVVASIGPSTSEALSAHGVHPDFEPSHPKMGFLVTEASGCARQILQSKQ
jgi:uroporphyrinogen-III synthase